MATVIKDNDLVGMFEEVLEEFPEKARDPQAITANEGDSLANGPIMDAGPVGTPGVPFSHSDELRELGLVFYGFFLKDRHGQAGPVSFTRPKIK